MQDMLSQILTKNFRWRFIEKKTTEKKPFSKNRGSCHSLFTSCARLLERINVFSARLMLEETLLHVL